MTEHKHAALLRMAADNADQLFECDEWHSGNYNIFNVLLNPNFNWRPVAKPKKTIKRWLWSTADGFITSHLYSDKELDGIDFPIKLLWSETEFEVNG